LRFFRQEPCETALFKAAGQALLVSSKSDILKPLLSNKVVALEGLIPELVPKLG
jgi:hypothetical protein